MIFIEGVGKQSHRCMDGYCSATLLMVLRGSTLSKLFHGVGVSDLQRVCRHCSTDDANINMIVAMIILQSHEQK